MGITEYVKINSFDLLKKLPGAVHIIGKNKDIWRNDASLGLLGANKNAGKCFEIFGGTEACPTCMVDFVFETQKEYSWVRPYKGKYIEFNAAPMINDGEVVSAMVCLSDYSVVAEQQQIIGDHNDMLKHLSLIDPLTEVYNRRGFVECLITSIARAKRYGFKLCLVMLDLDKFKNLNDTKGHHAGDEALREFTKAMRSSLRKNNIIARIGGDEFVIIMENADMMMTISVIKKIMNIIVDRLKRYGLTASVGIAEWDSTIDHEKLTINADRAMYAAKGQGGNKIFSYTG